MLRPIFRQVKRVWSSSLTQELVLALRWWLQVLELELCETREWIRSITKPCHLFCDARSTPPRAAAVLFWHASLSAGARALCFYCSSQ